MPNILLVTVTKIEAQAVLETFSQATSQPWTREHKGDKTYYDFGQVGGADVFMVQSEMGAVGPGASLLTVIKAIEALQPVAVIMVGIAFGVNPDKQKSGDILVARQIQSYEPQKLKGRGQIIPRGDRVTCSTALLDKFRSGDVDWAGATVRFGLILSGEKLIANKTFRDRLLKREPEAIGGEMEGAGLYAAASDKKVDWILVKAICDFADGEKNDYTQPMAAQNAAAFVLHVIQLGGWEHRMTTVSTPTVYQQAGDRSILINQARDVNITYQQIDATDLAKIPLSLQWKRPEPLRPSRNMVGRAVEKDAVRKLLSMGSPTAITAAVQGMPGVGKTVLAEHLAVELFPEYAGGVLFQKLGYEHRKTEQCAPILNAWGSYAFGGMLLPEGIQLTSHAVHILLSGHGPLLVVLDDVWNLEAIQPLQEALPFDACLLITTRNQRLANDLRGEVYNLDVLSDDDALVLVQKRTHATVNDRSLLHQLAKVLGCHAQALDIAAGSMARLDKARWPEVVQEIANQVRNGSGFGELPMPGDEPKQNLVEAVLFCSYSDLTSQAQERFALLGAFAPDAPFHAAAIAMVWQCMIEEAQDQLAVLAERALVSRTSDGTGASWQQHSLLRAYALALLQRSGQVDNGQRRQAQAYLTLVQATGDNNEYHLVDQNFHAQLSHAFNWANTHDSELAQNLVNQMPFFDLAGQLDLLISIKSVDATQVNTLMHIISKPSLERYFFTHLATNKNPAWFSYLKEKGYFNASPAPIKNEGGVSYPNWPALPYIAVMVSELPSAVVQVAENIQIENAFGMSILVGAFSEAPVAFAPKISQMVIKWLDLGLSVNEDLLSVILYWANNEQWDSALALIDAILTPYEESATEIQRQSPLFRPTAKFRRFDYIIEQFIKIKLPELLTRHCNDILRVLEQKIIQTLTIEGSLEREKESSYWRSSVESSSQNVRDDDKDILFDALIKATQTLLEQEDKNAIPTIDRYLSHPYSIFRRLAIHIIRVNENLWRLFLDDLYSDPRYWDELGYYHEYWLFTHQTFSTLKPKQKDAYLKRVMAKFDQEEEGLDKDAVARDHYWMYRRLWAIKDELSDTDVKTAFENLNKLFGDPDPPESIAFQMYSSGVRSGWISSKSSVELDQLSCDDLLVELKKPYQLDSHSFDEPTREGLAIQLGIAIKNNPDQFVIVAPRLLDDGISPLYVAHAIRGFRDAWKDKKTFDWEPVIELCHKVSQIREEPAVDGTPIDMLPIYWTETYGNARIAIVELLEIAVVKDDNAIPHKYLKDVRTILLRLVDDPNPSPEYEASRERMNGWDYVNLSLNVIRGSALATLFDYSLHLARIVKKDKTAKDLLPPEIRLEPEVRAKLTKKLDTNLDQSKAVHVNFGLYLANLYYLDSKWVIEHLDDIFPLKSEMSEYWQVAWDGYMYRGDFFRNLYPSLRKYYDFAVRQLEQKDKSQIGMRDSTSTLAAHLAYLYGYGDESLDGEQSIVAKFVGIASDDLISWFVKTLSPGRTDAPITPESDDWQHRKFFWCQRYARIKASKQYENHTQELNAYVWWIPHIPEPLEPFYEMIEASASVAEDFTLVHLFSYLAKKITDDIRFTVTLYEKIYQKTGNMYFHGADREVVSLILETAIRSDDSIAQESAVRTINLYGERGDERYRYLLSEVGIPKQTT